MELVSCVTRSLENWKNIARRINYDRRNEIAEDHSGLVACPKENYENCCISSTFGENRLRADCPEGRQSQRKQKHSYRSSEKRCQKMFVLHHEEHLFEVMRNQ